MSARYEVLVRHSDGARWQEIKYELGHVYGQLEVIEFVEVRKLRKNEFAAFWLCRCSCGKKKVCEGRKLRKGEYKSCGCAHLRAHLQRVRDNQGRFAS